MAYKNIEARRDNQNAWRKRNLARRRAQDRAAYMRRADRQAKTKQSKLDALITKAGRPPPETCELCGGPPTGRGRLHFDHCHTTDKFRGWLCHHCNLMLGYARDRADLLVKAAAYLTSDRG